MRTVAAWLAIGLAACASSSPTLDARTDDDVGAPADAGADATSADAGADATSACGPEIEEPERARSATPSPDGMGFCCAPGVPTCDCGYFGGFVATPCDCGRRTPTRLPSPYGVCDLAPPDWVLGTDAHGCSAYRAAQPATSCCGCPPPAADAGTDAGS